MDYEMYLCAVEAQLLKEASAVSEEEQISEEDAERAADVLGWAEYEGRWEM